jgi:hypothetical protein
MIAALGSMWAGRGRGGRVTEDTICGWVGRLASGVEIALEIVNGSLGEIMVCLVAGVGESSAEDVGQVEDIGALGKTASGLCSEITLYAVRNWQHW